MGPLTGPIQPMLAATAAGPFDSQAHIFEVLWDGARSIAVVDGGVRLWDRYGRDVTELFPELQEISGQVSGGGLALDGVIVALDAEGRPDVSRLRPRLSANAPAEAADLAARSPVSFQAFDLLYLDGNPLLSSPLRARKELLARALQTRGPAAVPDYIPGDGIAFFEAARQHGLEGIIAKEWASTYLPGERSRAWLKVKVYEKREFVVGGFTYGGRWSTRRRPRGKRERIASLLIGLYDEGGVLRYAGEVSGGFGGDASDECVAALDALVTPACPFEPEPCLGRLVFWCRPELCATVRFSEWTAEGQARFPVFEALRPDVPAAACRSQARR